MNYLFLVFIGICSAQEAFTTAEGCDETCLICFTNDREYCYQCKETMYFNNSGNCITDGIAVEGKDCPLYSFKDPEDQKCHNCPFECVSCQFNTELGAVECLECEDDMGDIEHDNKPWQLGDSKTCFCIGILDKAECIICNPSTQEYNEEAVGCIDKKE